MEIKNHILYADNGKPVPYMATPNRGGLMKAFEYLIEHFTGDNRPSATKGWFMDKAAKASAHILIDRDGNITQFAPFNVVCWHAGVSSWANRGSLNSYSIGIEMTNLGLVGSSFKGAVKVSDKYWQPYTDIQLKVCKELSDLLVKTYKLKDVLGHSDIAPGRKVDPGPLFPIDDFKPKRVETLATTASLNLRSAIMGTVITVLPKETSVEVLEKKDGWAKVFVINSKLTGWVSMSYLK